jgi:parallel beta-helix repeat protein
MKNYYIQLKSFLGHGSKTIIITKNSLKLLLSAALIFIALAGNATIYYVSTSGNDSNSGTSSDSPWKSLVKVNSFTFKPGDQILFRKGDQWSGSITVTGAGTSGSPILYSSYGSGAKPKIYGSEKIINWTKHSGNIYKATVSKDINQVFVNDAKIKVARYPNTGYFKVSTVKSSTSLTSSELSSSINYSGASWFGRTGYYFTPTHKVTSSSGNSITLDAVPQKDLNVGEGFFLMNKLAFLDQAGEWSYDSGSKTVYLWLPNGDSPANYDVRGSAYDRGIFASGKDYIKVQGLELLQQAGKGIEISNCSNWVIDGNDFNYPDGYAIMEETYGENHTISNNKIKGPNHIGIQLRTHNTKVTDNVITNVGLYDNIGITGNGKFYYGSGIFINGRKNIIRHNRITDINYNGIFFAGPDNLIEFNFIQNICLMKGDGGGVYTTQPGTNPTTGSVIKHNIIINSVGSNDGFTSKVQFGEGIYIDESAHGVTVEYNTVYRSSNAGIKLHKCDANIVRYNTVMDARYAIQLLNHSGSTKTQVNNNILFSTGNGDVNNYEPRQLMLRVSSPNATVNNNIYRNPYESTGIFKKDSYVGFSEWKSETGYDSNSKCNHTKLNTGEKEKLFYNDSKSDKSINLGTKVYKDIDGNQVTGSFTLKPFTSRILIATDSESVVQQNQSPVISDQYFEFTAPKKVNDFIGQVVASDPDAGQEITYSIIGGNQDGLFQINSSTGNISAKLEIPATLNKTVSLLVQVVDNATSPLSDDATISITIKASETEQVADVTAPVISSFSIPSTSSSLKVPVTLTASDNVAVTGYNLTETSVVPLTGGGGWTSSAPADYAFSSEGTKSLYAWVKDAAGNVSTPVIQSVTIKLPVDETPTSADSVEYITICEGQDYLNWTESGTYERVLKVETTEQSTSTNQILNPSFTNGTTDWSKWNATGYNINLTANSSDYNSSPSSLQVDCTANGTSVSSIQLMNKGKIALIAGKVYTLTFYAKASSEFTIGNIYIHQGVSPWTNYGSFDVSKPIIKTSWNKYTFKFTANQSATDGSFRIYLGNSLKVGQSVYFDDFSFTELTQEVVSSDIVIVTHLTVNPTLYSTEDVTITEGENYMGWTQTGVYTRTVESEAGCDSIITTNLTVAAPEVTKETEGSEVPEVINATEYITICEGEAYNGWTVSGEYEWLITSETGPDTIMITYLTVEETKYSSETIKLWDGENYLGWTESGHYERVLVSASGCDSIVVTKIIVRGKGSDTTDNPDNLEYPIISNNNDIDFIHEGKNGFKLYPNPAQTFINIEYENIPHINTRMEIIDGSGRVVQSQQAESTLNRIHFNRLNPGMYYLRTVDNDSQQVEKFIIK